MQPFGYDDKIESNSREASTIGVPNFFGHKLCFQVSATEIASQMDVVFEELFLSLYYQLGNYPKKVFYVDFFRQTGRNKR
jgi:hypothetical protein